MMLSGSGSILSNVPSQFLLTLLFSGNVFGALGLKLK